MIDDDHPRTETFSDETRDLARAQESGEVDAVDLPERFEVRRRLGVGGMGVVVEAHDRVLDRDVAVKVVARSRRFDLRFRERFVREARAAARLHHPGVVAVHDVAPDGAFIVMELVRGESLRDRLDREGKLPSGEVRRIARALLDALAAAHALGVVHRDVKPANVLLDADGTIKLADFGIAQVSDAEVTTDALAGTPAYMAPEQLRGGRADARADVYAVGATLFEAATGVKLHGDESRDPASALAASVDDAPLVDAIVRAVDVDPRRRHASAQAFAASLTAPRRRRRGWRTFAIGGAAAVAAAMAVVAVARDRGGSNAPASRQEALAEVDDPLAAGAAAFLAEDFHRASLLLRQAATETPQARIYLAIYEWWRTASDDAVLRELALAEAGELTEADRQTISAMRAILAHDHARALAALDLRDRAHPGDPLTAYLRMEARFHAGDAGVAMDGYRDACARNPTLRVGNIHALTYYASHGDVDGLAWAIERTPEPGRAHWETRALVAERRLEEAWTAVVALDAGAPGFGEILGDRIALIARRGDLAGALSVAEIEPGARGGDLVGPAVFALHVALGDAEAVAARRALIDEVHGANTAGWERRAVVEAIARIEALRGPERAAETAAMIEADLAPMGESAGADMARVLVAGSIGDRERLATLAVGPILDAAAAARAFLAEADGDLAVAMSEWRTAIRGDGTGAYVIAGSFHLARVAAAAGDRATVVDACEDVIEPTLFDWTWAATAARCRAWSAEAQ